MPEREPHERWFTRGTGMGLLLGVVLGFVLGDIVIGLMVGLILGAGIGVLGKPRTRNDRDQDRDRRHRRDDGAIDRGLLWLLIGLAVGVAGVLAIAPELLAVEAAELGQLLGVVLAAAVPGLAIVLLLAYRRRHDRDDEEA